MQPYAAPALTWAGWYAGVHFGWGQAAHNLNGQTASTAIGGQAQSSLDGIVVGAQIGYNWQVGDWVLGLEADWSRLGWDKVGQGTSTQNRRQLDSLASIRGRLGMALDNVFVYGTGGLAYVRGKSATFSVDVYAEDKIDSWGGVLGGGIEYKFNRRTSVRLEGLTYVFNKTAHWCHSNNCDTGNMFDKLKNISVIRVGANVHF